MSPLISHYIGFINNDNKNVKESWAVTMKITQQSKNQAMAVKPGKCRITENNLI
jgi:hypothetical protein